MAENDRTDATERSDETSARPTSARAERQQQRAAEPEADTFAVSDLVERSTGFLNQPSHVVAGALHGVTGDLTLDDARAKVRQFLEQPVTKEA